VIEVYRVAHELQLRCASEGWRFCLIGGLALQRWGEPRETIDVDVTLLAGFGQEERFVNKIVSWYAPRVVEVVEFAITNRVVLVKAASGVGIDIALGCLPFEESAVERASDYEFLPGTSLRTASAEDLIVMKAFASRPKDWIDVEGMVVRQGNAIDWGYVQEQLAPLVELKGEPEIITRLEGVRRSVDETRFRS
jgi:hypothetical protein